MKKIFFLTTIFAILITFLGICYSQSSSTAKITSEKLYSLFKIEKKVMQAVTPEGNINLPVYVQKRYDDKYISLRDSETEKLFKSLGCSYKIDQKRKKITIDTSEGSREINDNILKIGKEETRLSPPPFFTTGHYFIHLKHIPKIIPCFLNRKDNTIYADGLFKGVVHEKVKQKTILKLQSTSSFTATTSVLRNPNRYVVDLNNVSLSEFRRALAKKEIEVPKVGTIKYALNQSDPGKVRVVIPFGDNTEIQKESSKNKNEYILSWQQKTTNDTGMNFSLQNVNSVIASGDSTKYEVTINVSGSVTYETHRYPDPDNRIVIDIHKSKYLGKKIDFVPNSKLVEEVKAGQFTLTPQPVTRVVVDLKENYYCAVSASPNKIYVIVTNQKSTVLNNDLDTFGATSYPTKNKVICIDPGHGGYDPGALNSAKGLKEKDLTLKIALKTSEILTQRGWNVVMTRTTDRDVSYYGSTDKEELGARVNFAKNMKADVLVSIHLNAASSNSARGVSTHWSKTSDKLLGSKIHSLLASRLYTIDRKLTKNDFYLLKNSSMPAVLIETGFITSSEDVKYLDNSWGQKKIAESIADGIEAYFKSK